MRRGTRIAIGILIALAALLAINTVVVDNQTKSAETTIDGARVLEVPRGSVQIFEEGPPSAQPIVLIHCYACSMHWWDRLAPLLAEDHRVIRIDLLGFGGSEKPSSGYSIEEQADAVAAALDQLRVQGAVVVGHSMGFSVATAVAQRASQLVDRLVNLDEGPTTDACSEPFTAKLMYQPVIGEALWRVLPGFMVKDAYSDAVAPDFEIEDGFPNPDQVLDDFDAMTYASYSDARDGNDDFRDEIALPDRLRPLAIPLLSVFGTEDQICDPEESQDAYATVPGARIEEIDGAGHSPNVERPEETAALIEDFAGPAAPVERKGGGDRSGEASRSERSERGR
jgi:pimeloyl-ACP methyl ester carboxylesterase